MKFTDIVPFTAVCARLGVPTNDGRVLIPTQQNKDDLEAIRDLPLLVCDAVGSLRNLGTVDRVKVVANMVITYGILHRDRLWTPFIPLLHMGFVHFNPSFGPADLEEMPDGTIRVWTYPLEALVCKGPSAWSDMPRVRFGV